MSYTSNRLILKEFTEEDFDNLYSVYSNEKVMKYALLDRVTGKEELKPYFEEILRSNKLTDKRELYAYGIYLSEGGKFIGAADIEVYRQNSYGGCGEIGYFLLPGFWGCGYASETAGLLIDIGFHHISLHRLCASCNANNQYSENVMRKLGMLKEGELRNERFKDGSWVNELRYGILKTDWEKHRLLM
jgi:ribosomal-protein-alanine N-acetyltransferase